MTRLRLLFAAGWCLAGLLALRMVLRAPGEIRTSDAFAASLRDRCDMPAGTVVLVVPDRSEEW